MATELSRAALPQGAALHELPCVLFALRRESRHFRRLLRPGPALPGAPCWSRWCGKPDVLLLETGVGPQRVQDVLAWLSQDPALHGVPYRPRRLLFAGFAGALDPTLRVGDAILASAVLDEAGRTWPATHAFSEHFHVGPLLSLPRLVADPREKLELGRRCGAVAVDMESAAFADFCTKAGVPFACVRAISDSADTRLSPELLCLLQGGTVAPWPLTRALARRPSLLGELLRLARDTSIASRTLARALVALLGATASPCR